MYKSYLKRLARIVAGLCLCGTGSYMTIQANIGLAPWEALHIGISEATGIMYGNVSITVGLIIIVAGLALKEKIGFGTIMNAVMYPKWVDVWNYFELIPKQESMAAGLPLLFAGMTLISVGTLLYMGGAMGSGPRDTLMVGIGKRLPKLPIGAIRGGIEVVVAFGGFLLGAKIGLGTLIVILSLSSIMQAVFAIAKFEARAVKHENFADTIKNLRSGEKAAV